MVAILCRGDGLSNYIGQCYKETQVYLVERYRLSLNQNKPPKTQNRVHWVATILHSDILYDSEYIPAWCYPMDSCNTTMYTIDQPRLPYVYIGTCITEHSLWWRHQMETFSVLPALCEGNPTVTGGVPSPRLVMVLPLICAWTNGWAHNQNAGDLRRIALIMTPL